MNIDECKREEIKKAISFIAELKEKVELMKNKMDSILKREFKIEYAYLPCDKEWVMSIDIEFLIYMDKNPYERFSISRIVYVKDKNTIKEKRTEAIDRFLIILLEMETHCLKALDNPGSIDYGVLGNPIYVEKRCDEFYCKSIDFGLEDLPLSWELDYVRYISFEELEEK